MSFTADHPDALANGVRLAGQQLQPMHRHCNASKGAASDVDLACVLRARQPPCIRAAGRFSNVSVFLLRSLSAASQVICSGAYCFCPIFHSMRTSK